MMSTRLPATVTGYFAAQNRHDVEAMLAPFAEGAVVKDDGQEHRGTSTVRAWIETTTENYHPTVEVIDVASDGDRTLVHAWVSGTFPGSPVRLSYDFTLVEDRIARLEIG